MNVKRPLVWIGLAALLLAGALAWWFTRDHAVAAPAPTPVETPAKTNPVPPSGGTITNIYAHNLRLHQGPSFRVYIGWLRGQLTPVHKGVAPSFDDPESFYLNVTNGVMRANIGDICNYLNARNKDASLRDIWISGTGDQVKITAKFHKVISLPVELTGTLMSSGGNRLQIHIVKINLLKLPFKALLKDFHLTLASFVKPGGTPGIEVNGNDIYFDTETLLPPPHIRGTLTRVSVANPDLEAVFGNVATDVEKVEQWRNFLRLRDGSLNFGRLTMNPVDLMMIDISQDPWFDLDLANYQAQLVNGYTRMTPQAGLQIFMPDVSALKSGSAKEVGIEWFKNRNVAPPKAVLNQKAQ